LIDLLVYRLYGLTEEEVGMWRGDREREKRWRGRRDEPVTFNG